ncbi:MAG: M28 family peptidase [Gemmatimonadales bacterium]|nr:M28 family peptidase [Gemmatimonadales bacterium]
MKQPSETGPDQGRLERDLRRLAVPRHPVTSPDALRAAEDFIALELDAAGLRVERQLFEWKGREFHNVVGTLDGTDPARPWVVVGAHFDSVAGSPGADDNASGVAALLEVARMLGGTRPRATVQFVGFNLEEVQDYLGNFRIGSREYVRWLKARGAMIAGALVLEMLGFTGPDQVVPAAVKLVKKIPKEGNFLTAVGDRDSRALLAVFERAARDLVPLVSLAVPLKGWLVPDTRRSDNARFWDAGIPALMITDTADLRNPHYHQLTDTPETLDYGFLAKATEAVAAAADALAR